MNSNSYNVLKYFEEISKIPRCSYDEKRISDFLIEFGKKNGLKTYQDKLNNIVLTRDAAVGMEDKEGIILQGHMDMVCEKTNESKHDFSCDPIELIYEDGYLKANNTTLGADNGIAIAMGMAILTDPMLKAPKIEMVITTSEETGLEGVHGFKENILTGKYFINIDSEEEGFVVAGCAGGLNIDLNLKSDYEKKSGYMTRIQISNLKGGHSGINIGEDLLNANICMNKILKYLNDKAEINIISYNGGSKHNAIPRDCVVEFVSKEEVLLEELEKLIIDFKSVEKKFTIELISNKVEDEKCFSKISTANVIELIHNIPNGVQGYMSEEYSDIVETSSNLAIIKTDGNEIFIQISVRSSNDDKKEKFVIEIENIAKKFNFDFNTNAGYSSWEFNENSPLRDIAVNAYKEFTGNDMKVTVIHAGLECAVFQEKYKDLDMISIGPDMYGVHTPEEKLDLNSTKRVYEYLQYLILKLS